MKTIKHLSLLILLLFLYCSGQCDSRRQNQPLEDTTASDTRKSIKVKAPFPMPELVYPHIPGRTFNFVDFGASQNENVKNTEAIRKAIQACSEAGGGHVLIPSGHWLTGKIHLKSNIDLHLAEGAEMITCLPFSQVGKGWNAIIILL
jgi:polygalacturonase